MAEKELIPSRVSTRKRPPLILPPRSSIENIFSSFASPGPMTLVSSFFAENSPDLNSWSFSQLLAGAMSPLAIEGSPGLVTDYSSEDSDSSKLGFKQNRPMNLLVARSPLFTVPPGLSPSGFLNSPGMFSPGMFSPGQDLFGMSHQQALAQVTAQAALSHSLMHIQAGYQSASLEAPAEPFRSQISCANETTEMPLTIPDPKKSIIESSEVCDSDKRHQPPSNALDKPADDGYNWRKYGQKQVKGGECPRSYYKCTFQNCLVKKKVERSLSGQIIEIIYKGQHNHELPQCSRRAKDNGDTKANGQSRVKPKIESQGPTGKSNKQNVSAAPQPVPLKDQYSTQGTSVQIVEPSVSVEMVDDVKRKENVDNDDEPNPKRRSIESGVAESVPSHKTVTEQRIIVQTRSEVDLLDDGFRWRKYGQKVVKGNPHPRSYYKCTSAECNVRKHVERASTDAKAVITTYEGKHNHEIPAARNSGQLKPHKVVAENHESLQSRPVVVLQLKAEEIQA